MIFEYNGTIFPESIRNGNAVKYIEPFALDFCKGEGLDIGGFDKSTLKGAIPINLTSKILDFDAYKLPDYNELDFVFSSHCLEHLVDPIKALEYWKTKLKAGGVLFLYLPHPDMGYWKPENNRKHLHMWYPDDMANILKTLGYLSVFNSQCDSYLSFHCVGFKR